MGTILERILDGEITLGMTEADGPLAVNDLRHAVPVLADEVARHYWNGERGYWDLKTDYGPLRPPFERLWIEYQLPRRILATTTDDIRDRRWFNAEVDRVATYAETKTIEGTNNLQVLMAHFAARRDRVTTPRLVHKAEISSSGELVRCTTQFAGSPSADDYSYRSVHLPAFLAISLMHCKNVKLDEFVRQPTKKSKRTGRVPAPIRFTTIKLPGSASGGRLTSAEAGAPQALHIVRGHFKTFTEDAPLFGKRTGTYWWGWQTRGNAERGAVAKDYEVSPA